MKKTKLITQTGFMISGEAVLELWGGGTGTIEMQPVFLPYEKMTPKNILRCVNDNGFGCESISSAIIDIESVYDNGSRYPEKTIEASHKVHTKYFLGWKELREQGIKY